MSQAKDSSGLTPQERHQIIVNYLEKVKKNTKVFHLRWCPGDLLDDKILKQTPIFWYMRFGWGRLEIETLFYEARIYIDPVFENSLDAVFGKTNTGPRWLPPDVQDAKREKWNRRAYYKTQPWWQVKQLDDVHQSQRPAKDFKDQNWDTAKWSEQQAQNKSPNNKNQSSNNKNQWNKSNKNNENPDSKSGNAQDMLRRRSLLNKNLSAYADTIWQIISDYGTKDKPIDAKKFAEHLQQHGINVSPEVAQKLYEQLVEGGKMDYQQFLKVLKTLDETKLETGMDIPAVTLDDLDTKFNSIMLMKRILLAAANDIPFEVNEFAINTNWKVNVDNAYLLLQKLITRSDDFNTRLKIMEDVANKLGSEPTYNTFFEPENASQLLMGWMVQCLDERAPVQKTALDSLPTVFHEINENSHPDVAMGHLDDIVDGLFNVMDNPRFEKNHEDAQKSLNDIVDEVVKTRDADSVLYLAGLLGQKTDIGECTNPKAREAALDALDRIMLGDNAQELDPNNIPSDGTPNKEWFDVADNSQPGPSDTLMNQGRDDPNGNAILPKEITEEDLLNNNQKGKKVKPQKTESDYKKPNSNGSTDESNNGGGKGNNGNNDNKNSYDNKGNDKGNNDNKGGDKGNNDNKGKDNKNNPNNGDQFQDPKNIKRNSGNFNKPNPHSNDNDKKDSTKGLLNDANNPNKNRKNYNEDMVDGSDLDDDDTGKRGGAKRKSGNGAQDFKGKFGDDNAKRNSWANDKSGNGKDRPIRGSVEQKPNTNPNQNQGSSPNKSNPSKGGDDEKNPLDASPLTSNEIGDEFRNIVDDAVSNALMDPNKNNQQKAGKLVDLLEAGNPGYSDRLDPDAKNRYINWNHGASKKFSSKVFPKDKPLPQLQVGAKKLHEIDQNMEINIKAPTLPDI